MKKIKKIKSKFYLYLVNHIFKGTHFWKIKRVLLNKCDDIQIGLNTKVVGPLYKPTMSGLKIGENCWIGKEFCIEGNGTVIIGDNCDIAPCVVFLTGSHKIGNKTRRAGAGFNGIIKINDGPWIGSRTILLPGSIVKKGTIVGAGSIVTKELDENCVYVGTPVRVVKRLD